MNVLNNAVPVERKVEVTYKKPAKGCIYAKARFINTDISQIMDKWGISVKNTFAYRSQLI